MKLAPSRSEAELTGQYGLRMPSVAIVTCLLALSGAWSIPRAAASATFDPNAPVQIQQYVRAASLGVLEDFQVAPPVLTVLPNGELGVTDGSSNGSVVVIPSTLPTCKQTLVQYDFASSYGKPYVGPYTPPACEFNRVTWNLTVSSRGRQYDRLGTVSFGDIELFRTSTAEPTTNGIEWTYLKDMTSYLSLFKESQTIIFDLGNLITDVLDGTYNVTLTAAYFTATDSITPADLILPVSKQQGAAGQPSSWSVPGDIASSEVSLPRNVKKAVFTVAATGQATEEFWWSNVPQSQINTFESTTGTLYGYSPFREVQLYIDGELAGVAWPYPVIFTGGVVPGLWRPIVGIDAFDLKEDEIDITPWLPKLCDGQPHNFTIAVSGLNDDGKGGATLSGTTGSYWIVDGKVFLWLDEEGHVTTGEGPVAVTPEPNFQVTSQVYQDANGTNETLIYSVTAQRALSFTSTLFLSTGPEVASWTQQLSYSNYGNETDQALVEINTQETSGIDVSSSGYARRYSYPLYAYSVEGITADGFTLSANVRRTKDVQTVGQPVFPTGLEAFSDSDNSQFNLASFQGSSLQTTQNGTAFYSANQTAQTSFSSGSTTQDMTLKGLQVALGVTGMFPSVTGTTELFERSVAAVNGSVVRDQETLLGKSIPRPHAKLDAAAFAEGLLVAGVPGRGSTLQKPDA